MPEYLSPGVYVEEINTGSQPIEGVSTSTAGIVGVTERGPVNVPILITSFGEYTRWFGGYLNILDFSNGSGAHCYLPHAVEGFFTNQGKRVYVTRVLDTTLAVSASAILFDRATVATVTTSLLRAAAEATGTVAAPPPLYLLDQSVIPTGKKAWFRVGDGSPADYAQIDDANLIPKATQTVVPVDYALSRSHPAVVAGTATKLEAFPRQPTAGYAGTFNVDAAEPTPAGASTLTLTNATAADVAKLLASATPLLEIRFDPAVPGELRFAVALASAPGGKVAVTLDSGLARSYSSTAVVIPLDLAAATTSDTLGLDSAAGDTLVFRSTPGAVFNVSDLVIVQSNDTKSREVRRIGELYELTLTTGASTDYPEGTLLSRVKLGDDDVTVAVTALNVGGTTMTVSDVTGLAQGMNVTLDPGGTAEKVTLQTVTPDPSAANAPRGTATFTPALANGHAVGVTVRPAGAKTTAAVSAGAGTNLLALDSRLGITVGDILRIGIAPAAEYMTVAGLPAAGGAPPDPGNVLLAGTLGLDHPAGTPVRRQHAPTPDAVHTTQTVLPADPGATTLLVTDGNAYAAGDIFQVATPADGVFYQVLASAPVKANAFGMVNALTPMLRAHAAGSVVVPTTPLLTVQALDPGAWGNRLQVAVQDEPAGLVTGTSLATVVNPTHIRLASAAGVEAGTVLELTDPLNGGAVVEPPLKVQQLDRTSLTVVLSSGLSPAQLNAVAAAGAAGQRLGVRSREFRITIWLLRQPDPALPSRNTVSIDSETFRYLSMDPRHSRYVQTILGATDGPPRLSDGRPDGQSWYVRVHDWAQDLAEPLRTQTLESVRLGPETLIDVLPTGQTRPARRTLAAGDDSVATLTDATYIGADAADPEDRTGLFALMNVDEISVLACPGRTGVQIQGALITQCETMRYRFAVLDSPPPPGDAMADVLNLRQRYDTKYAALYYPWLLIDDPFPRNLSTVAAFPIPPAGHVAGIYARVDDERGVHKAPANEVVLGITGLQRTLHKGEQDILNPYPVNINVIRDFRSHERGLVVYGARVITSDSDWKYVNVRRLLIFIEASIDLGLQWAVFEPNDEPLWARVRRSITNFLTLVWRNGALQGAKPEQAFFVKCDQTTMTQTDIDEGRLIVIIGVAPVKPAEFVIIRIGLWSAPPEA
jgi:phage tail sheath protein FI